MGIIGFCGNCGGGERVLNKFCRRHGITNLNGFPLFLVSLKWRCRRVCMCVQECRPMWCRWHMISLATFQTIFCE